MTEELTAQVAALIASVEQLRDGIKLARLSAEADEATIAELTASVEALTQQRDTARVMLDNLVKCIEGAMGQRYKDAVTEACGDISVNTAFQVALRDERADREALITAVGQLERFVKELASREICDDATKKRGCELDSGPYCGTHDSFTAYDTERARKLLATLGAQKGSL